MAKQKKGGLGRGLNSLLGGESEAMPMQESRQTVETLVKPEAPIKTDNPAPVEEKKEVTVSKDDADKSYPEHKDQQTAERKEIPAKEETSSVKEPPFKKKEEINSSIEAENVTIKSVVERRVERKPEPPKQEKVEESKKAQPKDEISDEVDITRVHPNPNQPRTNFKKQELEELAESIKQNGFLQPILVREKDGNYEIIAGERRWQASKLAGMKKVPIRVRNVDDDEAIALALIENVQRSDLNPIEEAYGYRRMMEHGKMTQSQVAQTVSKGRSTIANSLRLLELPEEAQRLLFEEKITAGHARAILSIPTKEGRIKLTNKLVTDQLSVRETEAIARLMAGKSDEKKVERPKPPKSYKTVARSLSDVLQTDVRIKSVKGKNKIEISFKDEADLERLFRTIAAE